MKMISTEDMRLMIENTPDLAVLDVLPPHSYHEHHLPGAMNLPLEGETFVASVEELVPDKDQPVAVYCASRQCDASTRAARLLEEAGYQDVYDYKDGVQGWEEAGLAMRSA